MHVCDAKVQTIKGFRRDLLSVLDMNRHIIHFLGDRWNKANSEKPAKAFLIALDWNRFVRLLHIGQFRALSDCQIVLKLKPLAVIVACHPAHDEQVLIL